MPDENPLEPVSIEASLTESGVSVHTRSRFVSAVDRMFGGLFAIPAAFLEGRAARAKLLNQVELEKAEANAKLELQGEIKLKELDIAAQYVAKHQETKRILNLGSVTQLALEDLRDNEEPTASEQPGSISDDWLNWFQDFASKASSDEVAVLWGKILAGEARRPGRFSVGTLRTLAEVDQSTALLFQSCADHVLADQYIVKDPEMKGQPLLDLTALEDAGLLREVNGMIGLEHQLDTEGKKVFVEGNFVLELSGPPNTPFRISIILLSRAGRELFSLLPPVAPAAALRKIAEYAPAVITGAKLGTIVSLQPEGQFQWSSIEVLRSPQQ